MQLRLTRVMLGVLALLALSAAALSWRLTREPIPLPFLDRRIEGALSGLAPGTTTRIGKTELVWSGSRPEIRVVALRTSRGGGAAVLSLPEILVRPSLRALLRAELRIAWIRFSGLEVSLVRGEDGRVALADAEPAESPRSGGVLALLTAPESTLSRIELRDGRIRLVDRGTGSSWEAVELDIRLERRPGGLAGEFAGSVSHAGADPFPRRLALRITGSTELRASGKGELTDGTFDIRGSDGGIAFHSGASWPLHSFAASGSLGGVPRAVNVHHLRAEFSESALEASLKVPIEPADRWLEARGEIRSLPVGELRQVWPATLAVGPRRWVVGNVSDGVVRSCRFALRLPAPGASGPLPDDAVDVAFDFEGLTVQYLAAFDPLRAVRGTAVLRPSGFEAHVTGAESGNLRVESGELRFDLRSKPVQATIVTDFHGPAADLVPLLDRPPIEVRRRFGIGFEGLTGSSTVHLELGFPVPKAAGHVELAATARLRDGTLEKLAGGVGIEDGDLEVRVANGRVEVEGTTAFRGTLGDFGPVEVSSSFDPRHASGGGRLELALAGEDVRGKAEATTADQALRSLSVTGLRFRRNDLALRVETNGDRYRAAIDAAALDLEPLRERMSSGGETDGLFQRPIDVDVRAARVFAGGDVELVDVRGNAVIEEGRLRQLAADGRFEEGGAAHLEVVESAGSRKVSLVSAEGGKVLEALGLFEDASGGDLSLVAELSNAPSASRIAGELVVRDFRVVRASLLTRVLSLGSLDGIADLLRGEGIPFAAAKIPFVWSNGSLEIREATAVGAIGLTADGSIRDSGKRIEIRGSVIPAYTLNSALGKVPLIGKFLVGAEGGGVFGIEYRVSGSREKPDVRVDTLSALAPTALRAMFVEPFEAKEAKEKKGKEGERSGED